MASSSAKKRHEEWLEWDLVEWSKFVWGKSYARIKEQQEVEPGVMQEKGGAKSYILQRSFPGAQSHGHMLLSKEAGTSAIL